MSEQQSVTVLDILTSFRFQKNSIQLTCVAGRKGLLNPVTSALNRPGLALNGYFEYFGKDRIQLFGQGEIGFLHALEKKKKIKGILKRYFERKVSCCVVSHINNNMPSKTFIEFCNKYNCPLLYSPLSTYELSMRLYRVLNNFFSPSELMHGVFMDIGDVGVFIKGKSGVGKSEAALGLLSSGSNRLVADDVVLFRRIDDTIIGTPPNITRYKHHLEIRGLGFVNLSQIYGINVMLNRKELEIIIELVEWNKSYTENLDRFEREEYTNVLGVKVAYLKVPIKAGRNVSNIIETAAIKHRLKVMGYHGKEDPFLW